ncbi:hypothetical protein ES703_105022 [subsurface metagenome]
MRIQLAAINKHPTLRAFEKNTLAETRNLLRVFGTAGIVHMDHSDPILKFVFDLPARCTVRDSIFRKFPGPFNLDRPGVLASVSPLSNIHVVNTPVTYEPYAIV